MATRTIRVCDICGAEPADTVQMTVGGVKSAPDLCSEHLRALQQGSPQARSKPAKTEPALDTKAIRQWAADNGIEVSSKGRIPTDVLVAYRRATR